MRLKVIIGLIMSFILFIAFLLIRQSPIDMKNTEDLKKLNRVSDLFMVH